MPKLYIIGGPNGAGKTTTALKVFPALGVTNFVNADHIAQGISPLNVEKAAREAGRIMLAEMERLLENREDFALETTLASRTLAPFIGRAKDAGFRFILIYVWLELSDLAVSRVAKRVAAGGHNIPPDVIARRYERGRANFFELYSELADEKIIVNNSTPEPGTIEAHCHQPRLDIIERVGREAVAEAIETHRRMGRSIVVSRGGKIVHIKAKDIPPRPLPHDEWEKDEV